MKIELNTEMDRLVEKVQMVHRTINSVGETNDVLVVQLKTIKARYALSHPLVRVQVRRLLTSKYGAFGRDILPFLEIIAEYLEKMIKTTSEIRSGIDDVREFAERVWDQAFKEGEDAGFESGKEKGRDEEYEENKNSVWRLKEIATEGLSDEIFLELETFCLDLCPRSPRGGWMDSEYPLPKCMKTPVCGVASARMRFFELMNKIWEF